MNNPFIVNPLAAILQIIEKSLSKKSLKIKFSEANPSLKAALFGGLLLAAVVASWDWPLVWTLYYLERKCIRLKFVIEGWLAGPWRPQRWSLPWSSCAVRTCPRGFLELLLLLVVLWAAAELRSMRTTPRRQGDPRVQRISQQQSNFSDFLLKIWAVQQFNKSSLFWLMMPIIEKVFAYQTFMRPRFST